MGNDSYACHLEKIGTIRKKMRLVVQPKQRCQKRKIATKIRSRLDVLKRDIVKIVLVVK
jgi:hypothetical protein